DESCGRLLLADDLPWREQVEEDVERREGPVRAGLEGGAARIERNDRALAQDGRAAAFDQDRGVLADPVDERFRMLLGDAVKPAPALIPGQHWFNRGAANNTEPGNEIGVVTAEREDTLILVVAIGWIGVRNGPV